jgi:hypothetical protein
MVSCVADGAGHVRGFVEVTDSRAPSAIGYGEWFGRLI